MAGVEFESLGGLLLSRDGLLLPLPTPLLALWPMSLSRRSNWVRDDEGDGNGLGSLSLRSRRGLWLEDGCTDDWEEIEDEEFRFFFCCESWEVDDDPC